MMRPLLDWLKRRSKTSLTATGLVLVLIIGTLDRLTPPEMIFAIFYLPPILLVTWFASQKQGLIIAIASSIAWLLVNRSQAAPGSPALIPYWNAFSGLIVFGAVVYLLSGIKSFNDKLESRVASRTTELQAEVAGHQQTEELLRASEQRFRQLAEAIHEVFWMTDVATGQVIYVSPAYEPIWGRTCASLYEAPLARLEAVHPEDRPRVNAALAGAEQNLGYDEEYRIHRPDGGIRWIRDRAFPIYNKTGLVYRMAGIAEDITGRKELEKEVLEVSDREQRRIGQDLHDGLCQELTATLFATKILEEELADQSLAPAAQARQIYEYLNRAISQARNVARGLDPVKVATNGLMSALEELAATVQNLQRIECLFEAAAPVLIDDYATAVHLYRIAQEAVNNAVKHAQPDRIEIALHCAADRGTMTIKDNGTGLAKSFGQNSGMGMMTMNYRARMIGATLDVGPAPDGGTAVTCVFPLTAPARSMPS